MHIELHPDFAASAEGQEAKRLTRACVHCGFCLATCPTYLDRRDERDSPRGRIYLIKQLLETGEATATTHNHLDRCLTCRSCETTCPSGMEYGQLLDLGRGLMEQRVPRPPHQRLLRWLLRKGLTHQRLFTGALRLGQFFRPVLPAVLRAKIPPRQVLRQPPGRISPHREHNRTMLILEGCVQQAATPGTNHSARNVCEQLGITLLAAGKAGCCGAVNYHLGAHTDGLDDLRRNIDAWWPAIESGAEAIVFSATGCGAMLVDYSRLLAADPDYADKARRVSALARDLGQVLLAEDLEGLAIDRDVGKVAVHTPCSLQHGLGQPDLISRLLARAGFQLATTRDDHLCCGSAGSYSILQPKMAARLRERKLAALGGDNPAVIASGNVGCQLHLQEVSGIPVVHWIELLDSSSG